MLEGGIFSGTCSISRSISKIRQVMEMQHNPTSSSSRNQESYSFRKALFLTAISSNHKLHFIPSPILTLYLGSSPCRKASYPGSSPCLSAWGVASSRRVRKGEAPGTHCLHMRLILQRSGDSRLFSDSSVSCDVRVWTQYSKLVRIIQWRVG